MLLETIRCIGGEGLHLAYHQMRLERSLLSLGFKSNYDLNTLITPPDSNLYRCRFIYDSDSYSIEYHPYIPRRFSSLKLIHSDTLEYPLKYANRDSLNTLFEQRGTCDDVLIVKNGLLSDTSIANIALFLDGKWFTPELPILEGTTRARLIAEGLLTPASLAPSDITHSSKIALMNAMIGFIEVENGIIT